MSVIVILARKMVEWGNVGDFRLESSWLRRVEGVCFEGNCRGGAGELQVKVFLLTIKATQLNIL